MSVRLARPFRYRAGKSHYAGETSGTGHRRNAAPDAERIDAPKHDDERHPHCGSSDDRVVQFGKDHKQEASRVGVDVAPAGTPPQIVTRLNSALRKIIDSPDTQVQFKNIGFEGFSSTPEELGDFIKAQLAHWGKMIKDANIELD